MPPGVEHSDGKGLCVQFSSARQGGVDDLGGLLKREGGHVFAFSKISGNAPGNTSGPMIKDNKNVAYMFDVSATHFASRFKR
jgi:hypothetical protein